MSLAVIGGTGALDLFAVRERRALTTEFGVPSAELALIQLGSQQAWFLARHGLPHRLPPHRINYRANIQALKDLGVDRIIAINAVGGIDPSLKPGALVIPDQLIDYTWGRCHTFSDDADSVLDHVEFGDPFTASLRQELLQAAGRASVPVLADGCYAVTQGPRLETSAEVRRLAADGNTLVGMTAMPEAALARERNMGYASLCVVANPAAGVSPEPISIEEIHVVLESAMGQVKQLLSCF